MEFADENKIDLTEATKLAPGRPHVASLWRHCRRGVRGRNGERIFLEHSRFGGRLYTSAEAIERFGQRLAEADAEHFQQDANPTAPKPRSSTRARSIERAKQVLAEAGIA